MENDLKLLIDVARKNEREFTPIDKYRNRSAAHQARADLTEICDEEGVVFSVRKVGDIHFVGISFDNTMKCGGKSDEYCENCGVVHFDSDGLGATEAERKKKDFYGNWYKRIRGKSEDQT